MFDYFAAIIKLHLHYLSLDGFIAKSDGIQFGLWKYQILMEVILVLVCLSKTSNKKHYEKSMSNMWS